MSKIGLVYILNPWLSSRTLFQKKTEKKRIVFKGVAGNWSPQSSHITQHPQIDLYPDSTLTNHPCRVSLGALRSQLDPHPLLGSLSPDFLL